MRKGASPVIAALLLIGIAVAGSVITYTFVMSMVKSQGSMAQIQIRLDEVLFGFNDTDLCYALKVTIRNTGSVPTVIESIYIYKGDAQIAQATDIDYALGEKETAAIALEQTEESDWEDYSPDMGVDPNDRRTVATWTTGLNAASGYLVRVVSDSGFTVEGTYYSPSDFS